MVYDIRLLFGIRLGEIRIGFRKSRARTKMMMACRTGVSSSVCLARERERERESPHMG